MADAQPSSIWDFFGSPAGQGLLGAVAAGMAGARRGAPLNSFGTGLMGGLHAYGQAQDQQQQNVFNQQRQKLIQSQIDENDLQTKARQQAMDRAQQQQNYLGSMGQVTSPVVGAAPNQADPRKMLQLGFSPEQISTYMRAGDLGLPEVARTVEGMDAQGNKVTYQYDKFGRPVGSGVQAYVAPVQVDTGGRVQFVKPTAGVTLTKTMTPGERDASSRGWKALQIQEQGQNKPQFVESLGGFVSPPTKGAPSTLTPVIGNDGKPVQPKGGALTESQAKASLFLGQMRSASQAFDEVGSVSPIWVAATNNTATNRLAGADGQKAAQAQRQWAESYLRVKTGAAATKDEVNNNIRTFFPVVGDTPEVIQQKAQMRAQAESDLEMMAGPGVSGVNRKHPAPTSPTGLRFLGFE